MVLVFHDHASVHNTVHIIWSSLSVVNRTEILMPASFSPPGTQGNLTLRAQVSSFALYREQVLDICGPTQRTNKCEHFKISATALLFGNARFYSYFILFLFFRNVFTLDLSWQGLEEPRMKVRDVSVHVNRASWQSAEEKTWKMGRVWGKKYSLLTTIEVCGEVQNENGQCHRGSLDYHSMRMPVIYRFRLTIGWWSKRIFQWDEHWTFWVQASSHMCA